MSIADWKREGNFISGKVKFNNWSGVDSDGDDTYLTNFYGDGWSVTVSCNISWGSGVQDIDFDISFPFYLDELKDMQPAIQFITQEFD